MADVKKVILPDSTEDAEIARGIAADEDTWEPAEGELAEARSGKRILRELGLPAPKPRGRPRKENPKVPVSIRLDADVLQALRATGKGWQTRVNDILRQWLTKDSR